MKEECSYDRFLFNPPQNMCVLGWSVLDIDIIIVII